MEVPIISRGFEIALEFPELNLLPGGYVVRAHAMDPEGLRVHDTVEAEFTVRGKSRALGLVYLPHEWHAGNGLDARSDDRSDDRLPASDARGFSASRESE